MIYKQRLVLIIAVFIFLLSELFPPWAYVDKTSSIKNSAGFHFIFNPDPQIEAFTQIKERFLLPERYLPDDVILRKDVGRLNLQRLFLLSFMLGFLLLFDDRNSIYKSLLAGTLFLFGLGFAIIWMFRSLA